MMGVLCEWREKTGIPKWCSIHEIPAVRENMPFSRNFKWFSMSEIQGVCLCKVRTRWGLRGLQKSEHGPYSEGYLVALKKFKKEMDLIWFPPVPCSVKDCGLGDSRKWGGKSQLIGGPFTKIQVTEGNCLLSTISMPLLSSSPVTRTEIWESTKQSMARCGETSINISVGYPKAQHYKERMTQQWKMIHTYDFK